MKPVFSGDKPAHRVIRGGALLLPAVFLMLLLGGCAAVMERFPVTENARKFQEAEKAFQGGNYAEARRIFLEVAADGTASPARSERAQFNAAYILVAHDNPNKDYGLAAREFEELIAKHPSGTHAGEARTWLDILKTFEQSKTKELMQQVDALTRKMGDVAQERQKAQTDAETLGRERDRLTSEKNDLTKKLDGLLNDKDELLKEKAALLKERDGLGKDKSALEKKVDSLTKDKQTLTLAKEKLEKSLRELSQVDVKMEKKRRKVK